MKIKASGTYEFLYANKMSVEHKTRSVAGGLVQTTSTFGNYDGSPTLSIVSVRTFLVNAGQRSLTRKRIDFKRGYLNADLPTSIKRFCVIRNQEKECG